MSNPYIPKVRFIGDVHGQYIPYAKICHHAEDAGNYTVQVGDMGFRYGHFQHFGLNNGKHFWFGGNHDNYDLYDQADCCLGDFGVVPMSGWLHGSFFFVRGAYSIDKALRREGVDWWRREELDMREWRECFDWYNAERPRIMVTHDCPNEARDEMIQRGRGLGSSFKIDTRTGQMLQQLFEVHQPDLWLFGHWHHTIDFQIGQTKFQCIGTLESVEL